MSLTCKVLVTQQLTWKQRWRLWWLSQVQSWRALVLGTCVTTTEVPTAQEQDTPFFYVPPGPGDKVH